jgi:ABC-type uncharacterized transport system involved in gliding motility auxiliary subunit/ABC-type transport system involved in multi-copper enzyme maturation permease subunit
MKQFLAVLKRELKAYIDQPMAYVLAVVFLVINNFLFFRATFIQETASLRPMFSMLPWVLLFFVSALTMRTWAEERSQNTLSVLLSYPVKIWKIILAKFVATSIFVSLMLLLTLIIPWSMGSVGEFDGGVILAQYLGTLFVIMAMVAIGQWTSSLTKNQVIAFIISIATLFVFFFIGIDSVVLALPFPLNTIAQQLGMLSHYNAMTRGVIDIRDVLYFISIAFVFLSLSYAWLTKMKLVHGSKEWRTLQTSIAILVAIAIVINLFGQGITVRADLTEQNIYSLSPATKSVLRDLDDTINVTLYRSEKLPPQIELISRDVQDILQDYSKFGGRHLDLSIKYPDKDEDVAIAAQQAGIIAVRFNTVREGEFSLQEGYLGLSIQYLDAKEGIPFIQSIDDLEYQLTRSIVSLQTETKSRIGYVSDFGGKTLEQWSGFAASIREQSTLQQVNLVPDPEAVEGTSFTALIPEEIDTLIIAAPTQKYSADAVSAIEAYVNRGGKILWIVSGITVDPASLAATKNETGLETILATHGITLNQDLAADLVSHQNVNFSQGGFSYVLPYPYWLTAITQKHILTGNIKQVTMPWASTLTLKDDASLTPLLMTSDAGVTQESSFNISPEQLQTLGALEQRSLVVGALVRDIQAEEGAEPGRWVVIPNNGFLDDSLLQQHAGNLALGLNAVDWLTQNEALLSIRTKSSQPATLVWESKGQQAWVKWGNIVGIPILVVLFGGVWIYRRKRLTRNHA